MKKRKFGMQSLSVTQGRFTSFSHKNLNAMDFNGMDDGIDKFITFNELTLIKIYSATNTGYANTLLFYDAQNDVTLAFAHMNSIPDDYYEGRVFQSDEIIYYEGTEGYATGNHIHLEIGEGRQTSKPKIYINGTPNYQLRNLINAEDYFYVDTNYTTIRNSGGYTWEKRSDSVNPPVVTPPSTELSGCYLNATKSAFRVRSWAVNGTPLELVPIGGRAEIKKFLGIQSDGYQWVQVSYVTSKGCVIGYSQLDMKNCYTLSGACSKTLYLYATKYAFRLRTSAPSGSQKELCPVGGRAKILYFGNIASDGYQWAYVEYNGVQGWSQMDTKNCYTVNI